MNDAANGHPRELLSDYLDDELGIVERASIDRHLVECEDCREHLEALRRLSRAIASESVPPMPVDLAARIGRRLDASRVLRPRKFRFVVPATIAATLGAIGILVAIQWREGSSLAPGRPEANPASSARDAVEPPAQPVPAPAAPVPEEAAKRKDKADTRDDVSAKKSAPPANEPRGNVVGGAVSGVASAPERVEETGKSEDEQRSVESLRTSAPAAKLQARAPCEESWTDSGAYGTWEVEDIAAAVKVLDGISRSFGGIGKWRGGANGPPYVAVVPRDRFEEVYYAFRARGIEGLGEPPALPEGGECVGISVVLAVGTPR